MPDNGETPAYRDGWLAHKSGVGVDENPYDERKQSFSHGQWTGGWCERFSAVKHGHLGSPDWRDTEWGLA